jgi:hypothetical protein
LVRAEEADLDGGVVTAAGITTLVVALASMAMEGVSMDHLGSTLVAVEDSALAGQGPLWLERLVARREMTATMGSTPMRTLVQILGSSTEV